MGVALKGCSKGFVLSAHGLALTLAILSALTHTAAELQSSMPLGFLSPLAPQPVDYRATCAFSPSAPQPPRTLSCAAPPHSLIKCSASFNGMSAEGLRTDRMRTVGLTAQGPRDRLVGKPLVAEGMRARGLRGLQPLRAEAEDEPASAPSESELLEMVPLNDEIAVYQAQVSLAQGVASGAKRLRVDVLTPGLNELIENKFPYNEGKLVKLGFELTKALPSLKVTLLFESTGTAAGAQAFYKRNIGEKLPPNLKLGVTASKRIMRDSVTDGDVNPDVDPENPADVYLVMRPKNSRGDSVVLAVEAAVKKAPNATWVLVNPLLEDTVDGYTFGIVERDRRQFFVNQFEYCYYFRGLFTIQRPSLTVKERGAIVRSFDQAFRVYTVLREGGYQLMREFDGMPKRNQISGLPFK